MHSGEVETITSDDERILEEYCTIELSSTKFLLSATRSNNIGRWTHTAWSNFESSAALTKWSRRNETTIIIHTTNTMTISRLPRDDQRNCTILLLYRHSIMNCRFVIFKLFNIIFRSDEWSTTRLRQRYAFNDCILLFWPRGVFTIS